VEQCNIISTSIWYILLIRITSNCENHLQKGTEHFHMRKNCDETPLHDHFHETSLSNDKPNDVVACDIYYNYALICFLSKLLIVIWKEN